LNPTTQNKDFTPDPAFQPAESQTTGALGTAETAELLANPRFVRAWNEDRLGRLAYTEFLGREK
jgi:hypothetical protein